MIICLPENDSEIRYYLGKKGKRNLLFVGVNPNTANEAALAPTSKSVENIAAENGYDGWFSVNLYPIRSSKVQLLDEEVNSEIFFRNLLKIEALASSKELSITDILLGWGDDIKYRIWLMNAVYYLSERLDKYDFNYKVFRCNKSGFPSHPSPQVINTKLKNEPIKLKDFDLSTHARQFKPPFGREIS